MKRFSTEIRRGCHEQTQQSSNKFYQSYQHTRPSASGRKRPGPSEVAKTASIANLKNLEGHSNVSGKTSVLGQCLQKVIQRVEYTLTVHGQRVLDAWRHLRESLAVD